MSRIGLTTLAVACTALAASAIAATGQDYGAGTDWPAVGGGLDEAAFSRLDQIGTGNVAKLGLAWSLDLPDEVTLEATPLAIGGVLYFSGGFAEVYAVDAVSGKLLWKHDPQTWRRIRTLRSFKANRGLAYENGRLFVAEIDGRLDALDARSGKLLWSAETITPGTYNYSTGAPRTMNGKVIIGNGGADFGARGYVTAFDAASGHQLWRFYTVPGSPDENRGDPVMEMAARTWTGEYWKTGTGGTVWNGMTFDPELNRIYIGTGNAGPYDPAVRSPGGGDNLFLTSIVALDASTGKYIWHYQENQRDAWDYKSTANIIAADLTIDGKLRKVLLHAPTNGFFYVIDRVDGKLISAGKTTEISWAKDIDLKTGRPIENPNIRYETGDTQIWPGSIGGHNWQAMSFSPRSGLAYVPIHQLGAHFSRLPGTDTAFSVMGLTFEPIAARPGDGKGYLVAWDPVTQREAWRVPHDSLWNGGTLATAGGLVFQGTGDGWFHAYDATAGRELWDFQAGLGIIAAPMSFTAKGVQYVSVLVGYGGTTSIFSNFMNEGWKYGAQPRRILTFRIGGTAALAPTAPPDRTVNALDDPDLKISEADVTAGRGVSVYCGACHGMGLKSPGSPAPDLRESGVALQLEAFKAFLREGNLARGMPPFPDLTDEQIRQLHAYIRARAREQLGLRRPTTDTPAAARM